MNDEPITELKKKYLVIKTEDLDRYFAQFTRGIFSTEEETKYIESIPFKKVLTDIDIMRHQEGKNDNQYVVLNLDDNITLYTLFNDLQYLWTTESSEARFYNRERKVFKVKDIAVILVNAILKTKREIKIVSGLESLKRVFQGRK